MINSFPLISTTHNLGWRPILGIQLFLKITLYMYINYENLNSQVLYTLHIKLFV